MASDIQGSIPRLRALFTTSPELVTWFENNQQMEYLTDQVNSNLPVDEVAENLRTYKANLLKEMKAKKKSKKKAAAEEKRRQIAANRKARVYCGQLGESNPMMALRRAHRKMLKPHLKKADAEAVRNFEQVHGKLEAGEKLPNYVLKEARDRVRANFPSFKQWVKETHGDEGMLVIAEAKENANPTKKPRAKTYKKKKGEAKMKAKQGKKKKG